VTFFLQRRETPSQLISQHPGFIDSSGFMDGPVRATSKEVKEVYMAKEVKRHQTRSPTPVGDSAAPLLGNRKSV